MFTARACFPISHRNNYCFASHAKFNRFGFFFFFKNYFRKVTRIFRGVSPPPPVRFRFDNFFLFFSSSYSRRHGNKILNGREEKITIETTSAAAATAGTTSMTSTRKNEYANGRKIRFLFRQTLFFRFFNPPEVNGQRSTSTRHRSRIGV